MDLIATGTKNRDSREFIFVTMAGGTTATARQFPGNGSMVPVGHPVSGPGDGDSINGGIQRLEAESATTSPNYCRELS